MSQQLCQVCWSSSRRAASWRTGSTPTRPSPSSGTRSPASYTGTRNQHSGSAVLVSRYLKSVLQSCGEASKMTHRLVKGCQIKQDLTGCNKIRKSLSTSLRFQAIVSFVWVTPTPSSLPTFMSASISTLTSGSRQRISSMWMVCLWKTILSKHNTHIR